MNKNRKTDLLPWLMIFLAGICLRTGISSLAPVLDLIQAELKISQSLLGILTAVPVICMGLLSPLGGYFEQKFGLKRTIVFAFLILIVGFLLRLDSSTYTTILITATFVGISDAIIRPLLSGFIKETFGNNADGAMSMYAASMGWGLLWLRMERYQLQILQNMIGGEGFLSGRFLLYLG